MTVNRYFLIILRGSVVTWTKPDSAINLQVIKKFLNCSLKELPFLKKEV